MRVHRRGGRRRFSAHDGAHHAIVLGERQGEAAEHRELAAPVRREPPAQGLRRLLERAVVAEAVDELVEFGVVRGIALAVAAAHEFPRRHVARFERAPLRAAHARRRIARAQALEIRHQLEGLLQLIVVRPRHDDAAMRAQLGKADGDKLTERFAHRRARQARARRELALVEPLARPQLAGDDLVGELPAQQVGPRLSRHGADPRCGNGRALSPSPASS